MENKHIQKAKCTSKIRDKNNRIILYTLEANNGNKINITPKELKNAIKSNKISVVNLKVTSDNRLIDTKQEVDNMSKNIEIYKKPIRVKSGEWAFKHPNCDALIIKDDDKDGYIIIKAYALNEDGNKELLSMCDTKKYDIFGGIDKSVLNFIGCAWRRKY